jgi:[calcium/calmodulin-dependent protein kinase] kinase
MIPTTSADSFHHHNQFDTPIDDPAGYDGDDALESDDDDSDDGGLFIGKRKPTQSHRSESISIAEVARSDIRKEVMHSRQRSTRSGSNGTVKKIPPPGEATSDNTPTAH